MSRSSRQSSVPEYLERHHLQKGLSTNSPPLFLGVSRLIWLLPLLAKDRISTGSVGAEASALGAEVAKERDTWLEDDEDEDAFCCCSTAVRGALLLCDVERHRVAMVGAATARKATSRWELQQEALSAPVTSMLDRCSTFRTHLA